MKYEKFTFSPQKGKPGHCFCAQVWDEEGNSLATIESTKVARRASETAKLFSKAPEMLEALKNALGWLFYESATTSKSKDDLIIKIESILKEVEK